MVILEVLEVNKHNADKFFNLSFTLFEKSVPFFNSFI